MSNPADDEARAAWFSEHPDPEPVWFWDDVDRDEELEAAFAEWRRQDIEEMQERERFREHLRRSDGGETGDSNGVQSAQ